MTMPLAVAGRSRPALSDVDFDRAPFIVIWETTQAYDLGVSTVEPPQYRDAIRTN